MRKLTSTERQRVKDYIKNGLDISKLIEDRDIRGEKLSGAIIKFMQRINDNISDCDLSCTVIGNNENKIVYLIKSKMKNCNFEGAKFISPTWIRHCDARCCNFKGADVSKVDYRFSDFTGSSFCNSVITISTRAGMGCKFDSSLLKDLTQYWGVEVSVERKEE